MTSAPRGGGGSTGTDPHPSASPFVVPTLGGGVVGGRGVIVVVVDVAVSLEQFISTLSGTCHIS